ncbi:hypothetical protein SKAU_G00156770 [Synaphobranchus kaupii]|uniref:Uncharacterized protein n=1 Tax=Synaphobranchus kaupii TaxID=118154 RepID=A0A9Q1FHQ1_SYNKA|nr:hypothetical protein SKAU_G00156770 [Synaphobranchus kaupii]
MSVPEVQVGQSQEKVGLKRKLTGPPRLLLGKFRAKAQGDTQTEAQTKRPNAMSEGKGPGMASPKNQQGNMVDDGSLNIAVESVQNLAGKQPEMQSEQAPAVGLGVRSTAEKSEAEGEGWDDGSIVKGRAKKRSRRWFWTPSLVCIRRRRRGSCGEQGADGTFHDAKASLAGKLLVDDSTGLSKDRKASICHDHSGSLTEGKGGFSDKTGSTLKRLITSHKSKKPKGACSEPTAKNESKDQRHPKASFRKKMGLFFKRGSKNSSTAAEDRGTRAPLDQETLEVPATGHGELNVPEGDCSEAATESGGHLTVSVEVSALGQGGTEERNPVESSNRADGRGSPVGLKMMAEEYKPRHCSKDELDRPDRRLKSDLPSKTACGLPPLMEETPAIEKDLDWSPSVRADSHKDQLKESEARSPMDVAHAENDRIPEHVHAEDEIVAGHSLSGIVPESSVQDSLALNARVHNGIDYMEYLSRDTVAIDTDIVVTNGPMESALEDLHLEGRSLLNDLPHGELGPRNCEALIVQIASSLVQAALKAALDQLAAELEAAAAGVPQGSQACKCHL